MEERAARPKPKRIPYGMMTIGGIHRGRPKFVIPNENDHLMRRLEVAKWR